MGLKNQFISWNLNRNHCKLNRTVRFMNLNQTRTAGVLWKIDDRDAFNTLMDILTEKGIQVTSLCFSEQHGSVKGQEVFSPVDFSIFGKVKNEKIAKFIDHKFDILIDISLSSGIEMQYLRGLSKARFKVGWADAKPNFFDLSIDICKRKEPSYLSEQVVHYLSEINKQQIETLQ